ncbi:MAG: GntR family transcriptional regulator, transcriptional repressor for pyruvate dehydrogenase complex [Solirubrobacteraceae bacterium]|jgi:GntR family transcriptional repressor for pyruvate dehydrogenase complex|nr:GntR family transcriptional regulator, transcriptional repressor for pyruvate dehydrogenase complex [Solirubrobacteraceae bacterium]
MASEQATSSSPGAGAGAPEDDDRGLSAFRPVRLRKASDEVVAVLIDAIRGGLYRPGDLLPRERDLAARLEVSRDVIREAIEVLRREGILSSRRGRAGGTVVRSLENVTRVQAGLQGGMRANLRSLLEFRRIVEPAAALLCARHAGEEDLDALQALVDELAGALDAPVAVVLQTDVRFHVAVARVGRNDVLARAVRSTLDEIVLLRSFFPFGHLERRQAGRVQQAYLDALRTRDGGAIAAAVDDHLGAFEDVLLGTTLGPRSHPK